MIDLGRFRRRAVMVPGAFLVGSLLGVNTLGQAATHQDLDHLGLALQALIALVAVLGSVIMLVRALVSKRERFVRNHLDDKVAELEREVAELKDRKKD